MLKAKEEIFGIAGVDKKAEEANTTNIEIKLKIEKPEKEEKEDEDTNKDEKVDDSKTDNQEDDVSKEKVADEVEMEKNGTNIEIKLKIAPTDEKDEKNAEKDEEKPNVVKVEDTKNETDGSIVDKINEIKQKQQEIEVAKESIMSELEGDKKVALEEAVPDSSKEKISEESNKSADIPVVAESTKEKKSEDSSKSEDSFKEKKSEDSSKIEDSLKEKKSEDSSKEKKNKDSNKTADTPDTAEDIASKLKEIKSKEMELNEAKANLFGENVTPKDETTEKATIAPLKDGNETIENAKKGSRYIYIKIFIYSSSSR